MFERSRFCQGLRWTAGLLSLAVLASGLSFAAVKGDEPKQEEKKTEPKKESPKKDKTKKLQPDKNVPNFEDVFKNLPQGVDPEQMQQLQKEMQRMMEQMRQQFPAGNLPQAGFQGAFQGGARGFQGGPFAGFGRGREGRLGAHVSAPSATLSEQLDLPKGQGLVVEDVLPESAAAKAGIHNHDILLEFNGKAVPSNPAEFVHVLQDVKSDTKVDAVVLRKGKRETIKGLALPEVKAEGEPQLPFKGFPGGAGAAPGGLPGFGGAGAGAGFGGFAPQGGQFGGAGAAAGGHQVMTTVFRTDNRFTTRHQEGTLIVTVTGTVADGKAQVSTIQVQDGRESHKYESVDKVPEQYRDKVKNLIDMSQSGGGKIEIKPTKLQERKS